MANTFNKHLIRYLWIFILFLFGCSSLPDKRIDNTADYRRLEKRINDLSGTINLIVNDGNRLHNDIQEVKVYKDAVEQKLEKLTGHLRGLEECLNKMDTSIKTLEAANAPTRKTGVEEIGQPPVVEGTLRPLQEITRTNELQSDIIPPKEEAVVTNEGRAQTEVEDRQKNAEGIMQTAAVKLDSALPKQEAAVVDDIHEQTKVEEVKKGYEEMTQITSAKPDTAPPVPETTVISKIRELTKIEDIQKGAEEKIQTVGEKPAVIPPKPETTVIGEINEQTKRELFIKSNIAQLAEAEFPDNKGIQWNILGFEHKAHLTYAEAAPVSVTLACPRFKFVVSFKNPENPRVIGLFCFKDGQYSLWSAKK